MSSVAPGGPSTAGEPREARRYHRLVRFFTGVLIHALWWDVILDRPLLRALRPPTIDRWTRIAVRYRALAVEMGGVLIKLGQFLSTRVDLLPGEITSVLAELQDEVPAVPFAAIAETLRAELGPRLERLAAVEEVPLGAASLAQVHAARLADGEPVVLKVLRPNIERLVETDLAAIGVAVGWLRRYRPIARRVDVDALVGEFATTTRQELDLERERAHLERFAAQFTGNPAVLTPRAFPQVSSRRVLALENVAAIKISDHAALDAAGIERRALASTLFELYLEQIFTHRFVHADPHPGNLFVHPGRRGGGGDGKRFAIAFVDFGMMATVPSRLDSALRELMTGIVERDPRRMVQAYMAAGALLPGADLARLEEVHRALFDRFWGLPLGGLRDQALSAAPELIREFFDVIRAAPFQLQVDLLFTLRGLELVIGLTTALDPTFNPWQDLIRFASRLDDGDGVGAAVERTLAAGGRILSLPLRLDSLLTRLEAGGVRVQAHLDAPSRRQLGAIAAALDRLAWFALAAGLAIAGAMLLPSDVVLARGAAALAVGAALVGIARRWRA